MACNYTISKVGTDFKQVALTSSKSEVWTIKNTGTTTIMFGVTALTAPFSISPTGAHSLASGDSFDVTITFSPTTLGLHNYSGSPIASNCGLVADPTIDLWGNGSKFTQYDLPDLENTAQGTFKFRLFVDETVPDLIIPDDCQLYSIGAIKSERDAVIGQVQDQNIEICLFDDYENYSNGFWYQLIQGNTGAQIEIMFTKVLQNGDEEYYFRGQVYREECNYKATSIVGGSIKRTPKLKLVTMLNQLNFLNTSDFMTWIKTNQATLFPDEYYMLLVDFIASFFEYSMGYSAGAIVPTLLGSSPFQLSYDGVVWHSIDDFFLEVRNPAWDYASKNTDGQIIYSSYFNQDVTALNGTEFICQYQRCYDLLNDVLKNFFVDVEISYGQTDGTVKDDYTDKIILGIKSRLESIAVTPPSTIESYEVLGQSSRTSCNMKITEPVLFSQDLLTFFGSIPLTSFVDTSWIYSANGYYKSYQRNYYNAQMKSNELPGSSYDIEMTPLFQLSDFWAEFVSGGHSHYFIFNRSGKVFLDESSVIRQSIYAKANVFDPVTDSWSDVIYNLAFADRETSPTSVPWNLEMFKDIMYSLFCSRPKREIFIGYKGIEVNDGSTLSQRHIQLGMSASINDGIDTKTYVATKYSKDAMSNNLKITWLEK